MQAGYHLKVITDKHFYCPESFEILSKKKNKEKKKESKDGKLRKLVAV